MTSILQGCDIYEPTKQRSLPLWSLHPEGETENEKES